MPNPSLFQKSLSNGYSMYSEDVGKALIHMGTIGWTFSALAQIAMLAKNDKISKKDKKFLIPQEIADGVVNVGLYYSICMGLKSYCNWLCEKGKIILGSSDKALGKIKRDDQTIQNYIAGKTDNLFRADKIKVKEKKVSLSTLYEKTLEELANVAYSKVKKKPIIDKNNMIIVDKKLVSSNKTKTLLIGELKKAQSEFKSYKNGIGVAATITGSVLACNLVTPICRNLIANQFQTKYINKNKAKSTFAFATTKTFNAFKI